MENKIYNGLPIYSIVVDESDLEVNRVSIVGNPAIESNFLAFSNNAKIKTFLSSDDKRELIGAAIIPDLPIYRNVDGKEFYVTFSKETIKQIAQNLFKKGYNQSMNVEHTDTNAGSYIYQSFIVDSSLGLNAPSGLELPDGSWVIGVKVEDESVWNEIKEGRRNGFSVEGLFGLSDVKDTEEEEEIDVTEDELNEFFSNLHKVYSSIRLN